MPQNHKEGKQVLYKCFRVPIFGIILSFWLLFGLVAIFGKLVKDNDKILCYLLKAKNYRFNHEHFWLLLVIIWQNFTRITSHWIGLKNWSFLLFAVVPRHMFFNLSWHFSWDLLAVLPRDGVALLAGDLLRRLDGKLPALLLGDLNAVLFGNLILSLN